MTQWFRGKIEGFYYGEPDRGSTAVHLPSGTAAAAKTYRLLVYRAAIHDVELLDWVPPPEAPHPEAAVSPMVAGAPSAEDAHSATDAHSAIDAHSARGADAVADAVGALPGSAETKGNASPGVHSQSPSANAVGSDAANDTETPSGRTEAPQVPPLVLPPWLPPPGAGFFQSTITDARLFPVRFHSGWYEGPVHQVHIQDFRSTHSKSHGKRVYGRFTGYVNAYFALPPPPLPVAATKLLQAFQEVAEDELPPESGARRVAPSLLGPAASASRQDDTAARQNVASTARQDDTAATPPAQAPADSSPTHERGDEQKGSAEPEDHSSKPIDRNSATNPARHAPEKNAARVPFLVLVVLVGVGLVLTCGASKALLWSFFMLPTLLLRRVVRNLVPTNAVVQGASALLTVAQLWLSMMVFVGWWESGCRDVHVLPLGLTLVGLFVASVLPSDVPLLVYASTLAGLLLGWCTGSQECSHARDSSATTATEVSANTRGFELRLESHHPQRTWRSQS